MAFDKNSKNKMSKTSSFTPEHSNKIKQSHTTSVENLFNDDGNIKVPKLKPEQKKERYSFSLTPDVRQNIENMAKENNYPSSSALLNTIFKTKD
ncbi:TPA_asm: hypothetical protein GZX72_14265 [Listeria monocytogenes]|nr:hypothetical protein [Listeria monocytogenes]